MHCESMRRGIFVVNLTYLLFLRAVVNIPTQTLTISPWLFFRKMIVSQLELGLPVRMCWSCLLILDGRCFFSLIVRVRVQLFVFFQQKFKKQITARKFLFGFLYSPLLLSDDIWVCLSHYTARIWSIQINSYDMKRHTYRRNYWLWTNSLISFAEDRLILFMKFETFNVHSRISLRLLTAIDCSQQAAALCQQISN